MAKHSKKKSNKDYDLLFKIMTMISQVITNHHNYFFVTLQDFFLL